MRQRRYLPDRSYGAFLIGLVAVLAGCSAEKPPPATDSGKIQVVSTIFPFADWAAQVGGSRVETFTLLPAGSSPHTYEPSPREIRKVSSAALLLRTGLKMDDWGAKIAAAGETSMTILALGDDLKSKGQLPSLKATLRESENVVPPGAEQDHDDEGINPHFWLDPTLAKICVAEIQQALSKLDPTHAPEFEENARKYNQTLNDLDDEIRRTLEPCKGRSFVSFHSAYPYFAARYGLHVAAVIEPYAGTVPTDQYIKGVADKLRELHLKTVFAEPQLNPRVAEILADEIGAKVDVLDPYGSSSDKEKDSYVKLMRYDAGKLAKALSPARQ